MKIKLKQNCKILNKTNCFQVEILRENTHQYINVFALFIVYYFVVNKNKMKLIKNKFVCTQTVISNK